MKKIIVFILMILLIAGGFIMCRSSKQAVSDEDGNQLRYSAEDVEGDALTGIFVLNSDGTFSPAIKQMPNYQGSANESSPERFVWYTEADDEVSKLIPTVTKDSKLVAIFNQDGELPATHYLEKYRFVGYTIGAHVFLEDDKTMKLSAEDPLEGSQAAVALEGMADNTDSVYELAAVSGAETLPINNVDMNMQLLLGLQENKLYKFKYYHGTKEETITFQADTKAFQSSEYIPITSPYEKTSKGYFVVNLPRDLKDGYYYLSDMGFFRVKRQGG